MKKIYFLGIFLIVMSSCEKEKFRIENMEYSIMSVKYKLDYVNTYSREAVEKEAADFLGNAKYHFKFFNNDTLLVHPALGKRFFGDSVFTYKVEGDKIKLHSDNGDAELLLTGKRELNNPVISFKNEMFKEFSLVQKKVTYEKGARRLSGIYSLPRVNLGSKFSNALDGGYRMLDSLGVNKFEFKENGTLKMSSKFGMKFYGDSIFDYKFTDDLLVLDSKTGRFEIPYKSTDLDRAINLYPTNGNFEFIWLTNKPKKRLRTAIKHKSSLMFKGEYVLVGWSYSRETIAKEKGFDASLVYKYLPTNGETIFNFLKNGTVKIYPPFGKQFLGDTIFKYEVDGDLIRFYNESINEEMNFYMNHDILNLQINNGNLEIVQVVPKRERKN